MSAMTKSVFIAGTDTEVGKTFYSKLLLQSLNAQGLRTAAMKPLASGAVRHDGKLRNADALVLQQAASTSFPYELCNPYCFEAAIAPHLAARQVGIRIDLEVILQAHKKLQQQADVTVIEGVGGWLVPVDDKRTVADLIQTLGVPVILVVGMRLGCINHALLTADNIEQRGVPLLGWVANMMEPGMSHLDENIKSIAARIDAPLLDTIEFINNPEADTPNQRLNVDWLEY
jgi:dethiobiotin synthetase